MTARPRMFPARAGMNLGAFTGAPVEKHVPRTSGDEPLAEFKIKRLNRCSPHERG